MLSTSLPNSKIAAIELSDPGEVLHEFREPVSDRERVIAFSIGKNRDWVSTYEPEASQLPDLTTLLRTLDDNAGINVVSTRHAPGYEAVYVAKIPNDTTVLAHLLGGLHLAGQITKDDLPVASRELKIPHNNRYASIGMHQEHDPEHEFTWHI